MRYLAININYQLDQQWYYKCASVADCINYFNSLGSGHGPKTAIYDIHNNQYIWIDDRHLEKQEQLNKIVADALKI